MSKVEITDENVYKILEEIRRKLSNVLGIVVMYGDIEREITSAVWHHRNCFKHWPHMCDALEQVWDSWDGFFEDCDDTVIH